MQEIYQAILLLVVRVQWQKQSQKDDQKAGRNEKMKEYEYVNQNDQEDGKEIALNQQVTDLQRKLKQQEVLEKSYIKEIQELRDKLQKTSSKEDLLNNGLIDVQQ